MKRFTSSSFFDVTLVPVVRFVSFLLRSLALFDSIPFGWLSVGAEPSLPTRTRSSQSSDFVHLHRLSGGHKHRRRTRATAAVRLELSSPPPPASFRPLRAAPSSSPQPPQVGACCRVGPLASRLMSARPPTSAAVPFPHRPSLSPPLGAAPPPLRKRTTSSHRRAPPSPAIVGPFVRRVVACALRRQTPSWHRLPTPRGARRDGANLPAPPLRGASPPPSPNHPRKRDSAPSSLVRPNFVRPHSPDQISLTPLTYLLPEPGSSTWRCANEMCSLSGARRGGPASPSAKTKKSESSGGGVDQGHCPRVGVRAGCISPPAAPVGEDQKERSSGGGVDQGRCPRVHPPPRGKPLSGGRKQD